MDGLHKMVITVEDLELHRNIVPGTPLYCNTTFNSRYTMKNIDIIGEAIGRDKST